MDDYSKGVPSASISERVWGVPEKKRTEDRNSANGRPKGKSPPRNEKTEEESEHEESQEPEESCYGSHGTCRKRNRQVDVVI